MNENKMTITLDDELPEMPEFAAGIRRAPSRGFRLTEQQTQTALKNALRYIAPKYHAKLIPEFLNELYTRGRIYGYRFRPEGRIGLQHDAPDRQAVLQHPAVYIPVPTKDRCETQPFQGDLRPAGRDAIALGQEITAHERGFACAKPACL